MSSPKTYESAREVLRKHWGHPDFRPGQWDVIETVLQGRDLLAILPTGGGKSVCYQIPALLLDGLTIVISPLIALMQDQVAGLKSRGVDAAFINSALSVREIDQRWTDAEHGRYKLLYVAPERLTSEMFLARAKRLNISLLAVDEAHCISEWGHNFRPSYLEIARGRAHMGDPTTIAVTATATPHVRDDIVEHLKLRKPKVIVRGFDRPNVVWSIFQTENKRNKVLDVLENVPGAGILYSATRKGVEEWSSWLSRRDYSVASYHGGMRASVREQMQDSWISGERRIMVATNAFGMGIDKPDVRYVVHVDLPSTLEGYYQEAGRGGRDGKTSYAALIYHPRDDEIPRVLIDESHPSAKEVREVYDAVCNLAQIAVGSMPEDPVTVDPDSVNRLTGFYAGKIRTAVDFLERQEAWRVLPTRKHFGLVRFSQPADAVRNFAASSSNAALAEFVENLLRTVHADAFSGWWEVDLRMLGRRAGLERSRLLTGLEYMRKRGILDWHPPDRALRVEFAHPRSAQLPIDGKRVKRSRRRAEERLKEMIRYARSTECRRHFLLTYFGEVASSRCGTCDVCLGRHEPFSPRPSDEEVVSRILKAIREGKSRNAWFEEQSPPSYRIDGLVNWLIQEGFMLQPNPLQDRFELTPKGERAIDARKEAKAS